MLKVMLVVTDQMVADKLVKFIDWEALQLVLLAHISDPEHAVSNCEKLQPDILIVDMDIPNTDTVMLLERLRGAVTSAAYTLIAGQKTVEAMSSFSANNSVSWISRPILADAVNNSLRLVINDLKYQRRHRLPDEIMENLIDNNLQKLQENFLLNVMLDPSDKTSDLDSRAKRLNLPCTGPYYTVAVVAVPSLALKHNNAVILFFMRDILLKHIRKEGMQAMAIFDLNSRLNCAIGTKTPNMTAQIDRALAATQEELNIVADTQAFIGVGTTAESLYQLYESRSTALSALNCQCILGDTSVLHFSNMTNKDLMFHTQETIQGYLLQLFRDNDLEGLTRTIGNHVKMLRSYGQNGQRRMESFLLEYVQNISNESLRRGISMERFESYIPAIVFLMQSDTASCVNEVLKLTEQTLKSASVRRTNESNHLLVMAKEYINAHIGDESLCLEAVSDHVGLSRIYFCKLFHQLEGVNFNTYLKRVRIERAKQLLLSGNMRVFEVSSAVGFSHAKYFGQVFREMVGVTPTEFQKRAHDN